MESLSLSELNEYIQRVIALNFEEAVWVHFELSNVKFSRGHLYFDCLEKKENSEDIIARSSGAIWARQFSFIKRKLKGLEEEILRNGVRVSAKVMVNYHPRYGLKMIIEDIDPAYTFGELAIEKDKTWKRIQKEGLDQLNNQLYAPDVVQRIAILSNDSAAGYADFIATLEQNSYGYDYDFSLFETAVQGNQVKVDIPDQVEVINAEVDDFDLVVVLRGGGSKLDMQAFDQYEVVKALARCEIPVWIGVGHETDESLSDQVCSLSFKTPTAVAQGIHEQNARFENELLVYLDTIQQVAFNRIKAEDQKMDWLQYELSSVLDNRKLSESNKLEWIKREMTEIQTSLLKKAHWNLEKMSDLLDILHPSHILNKGFSIIEKNNKRIKSGSMLKSGDEITIHFKDKPIDAKVK